MHRAKIPEVEINKKLDFTETIDTADVIFFKKYLHGATYDQLCKEYNISKGQAEIRLHDIMYKLPDKMKVPIPDRNVIINCIKYKNYWLSLIKNYEIGLSLYNNNLIFTNFLNFFKKLPTEKKEFIIKQLQENI